MESTKNILSYDTCKDLKKVINPKTATLGIILVVIGLVISIFLSTADPKSNLNMLRMFCGWAVTAAGLCLLLFNLRHWVYAPTHSAVRRTTSDYTIEQMPQLRSLLENNTSIGDFRTSDISKVHLDFYASADKQFVALQVMQYATFGDRPLTDVEYLYNDKSEAFLREYAARRA